MLYDTISVWNPVTVQVAFSDGCDGNMADISHACQSLSSETHGFDWL